MMQVQPYVFFEGRAEEAIDFYVKAIGAERKAVMHYSESPDPTHAPPGSAGKVMHGEFRVGETVVMCSDGMCSGNAVFKGFALTLSARDTDEANRFFNALGEGGQVQMALSPTFFSAAFGMVHDKFGVMWMVIAPPA